MPRNKGNLAISANWEPQKAAPFDARSIVNLKSDLILTATWQGLDNNVWAYVGMTVTVMNDSSNNGVYMLISPDYATITNWKKLADEAPVDGKQYVKKNGLWVELVNTITNKIQLNYSCNKAMILNELIPAGGVSDGSIDTGHIIPYNGILSKATFKSNGAGNLGKLIITANSTDYLPNNTIGSNMSTIFNFNNIPVSEGQFITVRFSAWCNNPYVSLYLEC